jgi:hypothetical protein
MNYRKIWENYHGKIPFDSDGRVYDIHHIDGNRKNNDINNLICLSLEDHYKLHLQQYFENGNIKDLASARILSGRLGKKIEALTGWSVSEETKEKIRKTLTGKKRPKEVVDKVREKLINYKWSEDQIQSRVNGLKKFYESTPREDRIEWRNNISEAHLGKIVKEETKEKLSKLNSKLTDNEALEVMDLIMSGERYKLISEKYNISQSQITSIKQKKTYKWLWS